MHIGGRLYQGEWPGSDVMASTQPGLESNRESVVYREAEGVQAIPKKHNELKAFLVEEWKAIRQSTIDNLIALMMKRCELVIQNKGERIPYYKFIHK